ncbi:response regulator transcription factor [Rhizorhapis sp. SPR117]|uniref:response regulator transcription factor n=1 Tax=Rhizorhapis sp. SPR117 TaxID=2912611 RepID=UPI001F2358BF|nr:response regulator transcription factor [Rhizorhapis sp. SPR117]
MACQHSKELAYARFDDGPPDVIILQAAGQDLGSAEFSAQLQTVIRAFPATGIMLLSGSEHVDQMLAAFEQGVGAYITGNLGLIPTIRAMQLMREGMIVYPREILTDLRKHIKPATSPQIHEHEAGVHEGILTPRQRDVLLLLAQGLSNKAIAGNLTISESTVKVHIRAIMERTGMLNRTQIVAHFFRDR